MATNPRPAILLTATATNPSPTGLIASQTAATGAARFQPRASCRSADPTMSFAALCGLDEHEARAYWRIRMEQKNLDIYGDPPIPWSRALEQLEATSKETVTETEAPRTYWLSTVLPDGRPHLAGIGALWQDG